MSFLKQERATLEQLLPGLDAALAKLSLVAGGVLPLGRRACPVLAPVRLSASKHHDAYLAGSPLVLD